MRRASLPQPDQSSYVSIAVPFVVWRRIGALRCAFQCLISLGSRERQEIRHGRGGSCKAVRGSDGSCAPLSQIFSDVIEYYAEGAAGEIILPLRAMPQKMQQLRSADADPTHPNHSAS